MWPLRLRKAQTLKVFVSTVRVVTFTYSSGCTERLYLHLNCTVVVELVLLMVSLISFACAVDFCSTAVFGVDCSNFFNRILRVRYCQL